MHTRSVIHELLWFLRGETNLAYLHEHGVTIWDEWADEHGELGPDLRQAVARLGGARRHGTSIRWPQVVEQLRSNPNSRRIIVSAWNVGELDRMALAPCHAFFQFYVARRGGSPRQVYQRSADIFLGVPFNIASYALLTHMLAQQAHLVAGDLIWTGGDCHLVRQSPGAG